MLRIGLLSFAFVVWSIASPLRADEGSNVYKTVLKSTVWIQTNLGGGRIATGTGSLIDNKARLVLTNYHVVGDTDVVRIMFPKFNADNSVVAERSYYSSRIGREGIRGRVVTREKRADLAVVQLDELPNGVPQLPLASKVVEPGQSIHSIGNPGTSGALWVYTPGKVRQVYQKRWEARMDKQILSFQARVIETDSATNPGDSGGPLVNDKAELVGVTQGLSTEARLLSTFIDLTEVRAILDKPEVRRLTGGSANVPVVPAKPKREKALTIKDEAKFFSPEAVEKANKEIEEIFTKFKRDVLIETYANVPEADADAVSTPQKRHDYFTKRANERAQAEGVRGLVFVACKSPPYLQLKATSELSKVFTEKDYKALQDDIIKNFRDKKFDDGLASLLEKMRKNLERSLP